MGVARFTLVGFVSRIHEKKQNTGTGTDSITLEVDNDGETYYVLATGRQMLEFVETKLKKGDTIYTDGRCRRDKHLHTDAPKNILIFLANNISVLAG